MSEQEEIFGRENPPQADSQQRSETQPSKMRKDKFVDIHCHCLPNIDDGPATMADAISLCRLLARDRISTVVATPHQLGQFDTNNDGKKIKEKVNELNIQLQYKQIPLKVLPGADVRIDERIVELIKSGEVLTVADGGRYLLLEMPENILINIEPLVEELSSVGIKVIISHPERQHFLAMQPQIILKWSRKKCGIQITAGSLLGRFGSISQKAAWQILSMPVPLIVATDSHNTAGRSPCMRAAFEMICRQSGDQTARTACIENPTRVIEGKELLDIQGRKMKLGEHARIQNIFGRPAGAEQNRLNY
jgi:protein-tyrosine phosphatase